MSHIVQAGARKLPTMLGAGILAVAGAGLFAGAVGLVMPLGVEIASAGIGMVVGSRFA